MYDVGSPTSESGKHTVVMMRVVHSEVSINARCLTCSIYKVYIVASKSPNQNAVHTRLSPTGKYSCFSIVSISQSTMQVGTRASPHHPHVT